MISSVSKGHGIRQLRGCFVSLPKTFLRIAPEVQFEVPVIHSFKANAKVVQSKDKAIGIEFVDLPASEK
jgi:hypothetical protein